MKISREGSAVYLALVAGYVNSAGLLLFGTFTSHVTGNIGQIGFRVINGELTLAAYAFLLVFSFFVGAVFATLIARSSAFTQWTSAHCMVESAEGVLLLAPLIFLHAPELQASLLALAMGMQNSLIKQISGARIRTSHMTGIVTDLGIETAKCVVRSSNFQPKALKLLVTLLLAFITGAFLGAFAARAFSFRAMIFPSLSLFILSGLTCFCGRVELD